MSLWYPQSIYEKLDKYNPTTLKVNISLESEDFKKIYRTNLSDLFLKNPSLSDQQENFSTVKDMWNDRFEKTELYHLLKTKDNTKKEAVDFFPCYEITFLYLVTERICVFLELESNKTKLWGPSLPAGVDAILNVLLKFTATQVGSTVAQVAEAIHMALNRRSLLRGSETQNLYIELFMLCSVFYTKVFSSL